MEVKIIKYGTDDYNRTLILRNNVLRRPWKRSIYDEDLKDEIDRDIIFGAFDEGNLLGVGTLSHNDAKRVKIRFLTVDPKMQGNGAGSVILENIEKYAKELGYKKIILEARLSVMEFYVKHGYKKRGKIFISDFIPVEHVDMEKSIS
jgi:N-acetylglutamate synthase-like GNAT family acetyltransferase